MESVSKDVDEVLKQIKNGELSAQDGFSFIKNDRKVCRYKKHLVEKELAKTNRNESCKTILVFSKDDRFMKKGQVWDTKTIIRVTSGTKYCYLDKSHLMIDPERESDYEKLFEHLKKEKVEIDCIVNLFLLDCEPEKAMDYGVYSFYYILKYLSKCNIVSVKQMYGMYRNHFDSDASCLSGFCKSAGKAVPGVSVCTVEVDALSEEKIDLALQNEINYGFLQADREIVYCNEKRYERKIKEYQPEQTEQTDFRQNGVYLITGGMGKIGNLILKELSQGYHAKFIVCQRKPYSDECEETLIRLGIPLSDVLYCECNIEDKESMEEVKQKAHSKFGVINGIFHCAGIVTETMVTKEDREVFSKVISTKAKGIKVLDEVFKEEKIDFFYACSSISSVIGDFGQCSYAIANRNLEVYMQYRENLRTQGKRFGRSFSVSWPLWKDGGMHVFKGGEELYLKTSGMEYLENEEGLFLLKQSFKDITTNQIIFYGNKEKIAAMANMESEIKEKRKCTKKNYTKEAIINIVKDNAAAILESSPEKLDENENISEYGFDSISLRELAERINSKFDIQISPTLFYAYTTIESIVEYLLSEYKELSYHEEECEEECEEEVVAKAEAESEVKSDEKDDDIAIIGMDGMLPESSDLKEFFKHILNGDDCTKEIPSDRWDYCDFYTQGNSTADKVNAKWGGFIPDMKKFDPRFFGISPREAGYMDPQQRIFLKTTWNAIEDAGYRVSELSGKNIGVFVGMQFSDYQELLRLSSDMDPQMETGNAHTMLSNRVSYMFNFHGPSENIDTACSSSLVAVHRAIQSIRNRESDMAIAGGVSLIISPLSYLATGKLGILSKTGSGKTFDQDADGYVKGEGVISIFLKRLSDAERDHDHIYAVIKGSAVNHGGHANTLTSPNPNAQAELLCKAWKDANVEPDTVSFIETHGTGTKLGDPIEIDGLKMAFSKYNSLGKEGICGLGSVKPNIGHLEPASGIAGLVKVVLAMQAKKIPGTIHIKKLNEYLKLEHSPFYIVDKTREWKKLQLGEAMVPRRAGVSSFGFGGTNAHVVLEEYDVPKEIESKAEKTNVVVFSAKSKESLQGYIKKILVWLKENTCKEAENEEIYSKFKQKIFHLVAKVLFVNDDSLETDISLQEYEVDEIAWNQLKDSIEEAYSITCSEMDLYQNSIQNMVYSLWNHNKEQILSYYLSNYNTATVLEETKEVNWESFCYTLQLGREEMKERAAFVVSDFLELIHKMTDYLSDSEKKAWYTGTAEDSSVYQGQRMDYDAIAKAWCRGEKIDWTQLYDKVPFKMSLPTYAFVEQEYWLERTIDWGSFFAWRSGKKMIAAENNTSSNMLYKRILVEDGDFARGKHQLEGCYIILLNQRLEECFYESIRENSQTKWILIGKNQPENELKYIEADLTDYDQCNKIIQNLLDEYHHITGIIDLTALETRSDQIESVSFGTIAIMQQLVKANRNTLSVLQITRGLEAGRGVNPSLAGATLQGFIEEIRYEYAGVSSMSVDIDFQIHDILAIADLLELLNKETHELCIRNNKIYKPSIVEMAKPANKTISFSSEKVYVIAGGTSGIGLQMMDYMMKKGAKRFLVLCHHVLPERSKWAHIIETTQNQKEKNKLRMLDKLYQAGAEILVSTVRLSDETGISSLLAEVRSKGRKIGGFIQAASYDFQENPLFIDKKYDDFDKVMEPKVYGTQVIAKCMESDTLDFFLVFSSVASILPHRSVGMSHYVAANRFMDRFIAYKRACGHSEYKCVNWVLWGETGNACKQETVQAMKKYGMLPMTNAEGVKCFEQILEMDEQQVIAGHLDKRLAGIQSERCTEAAVNVTAAPDKEVSKKGSKEALMEKLRSIIANVLKLDVNEIKNQEEFGIYGVDSIIMQVLVHKMESELNMSLNPAIIIENETLEKLTDEIFEDSNYGEQVLEETQEEETQKEEIQKEVTYNTISIQSHKKSDKIAVIGISCDFPGGKGKEAYWNVLKEGKDCVTEIPQARWDKHKYYDPDGGSLKTNSKWGGFIDDAELFDAAYFKIKEADAKEMDPLQRKFLESTAETIADAGYSERELWGHKIGVFGSARVSNFAYKLKNYDKNTIVGTAQNFVTAQVAQYFNFTGPNMVIDTACSSSLVAIHQACTSILQGECEMAIAGGVEILLDEKPYLILGAMKGLSPTGTCHTFDRRADGFVPGEGVGTVLLKRLEDAIQDGDNIYGVVEGSFTNNDGNTMGITTPNPTIQHDLLLNTYERACIDPSKISYIEAHGTGTMIGDPIELKSLTNVFRQYTDKKRFCAIGSVKANIGHLLLASGVAGVIKILLALQHKQLPKSLHCEQPNKRFNFYDSPFYIVDHLSDWNPFIGDIRMAGISSFGLGGTNAHVILRELNADEIQRYEQKRFPREIVFHRKAYPWNDSNQKTEQAQENRMKSILRLKKLD